MPFTARKNTDILKGSKLMVFLDGAPIGFATSHSLSMTTNTTQISTKDHGDFPSTIPQNITWEVSAENLYSNAGEDIYMKKMKAMSPITLVFAQATEYSTKAQEPNPMPDTTGGSRTPAEWTLGQKIAEGNALITSLSINAPAGDNATMSVTFTGTGELKMYDKDGELITNTN